ncbi:unnamed protein product [Tetraodon nigroviridis]|uniref:Chromosome undetermined SCAF14629, whole genome shotgun sequence n=1 Tax=Tetraodon nigroviridis TaxID=99883 RepID=Q4SDV3_TETNG|nr:unnamed protein product [Tetraodon nigroviridis]
MHGGFYVRSNCPFTLTRFTQNRVECDITTRRDDSGLLVRVEIIINKIRTVLQNGSILVEGTSVSLPYDHTYQHIFQYGIYVKLRSSLLPLSVTWHNVPGGLDALLEEYTFSHNLVKIGEDVIGELHTSDHALVFWESSMYVQVHTSLGLKIQVQVSPEIQMYLTPPANHMGPISGLCGNSNSDTRDDFTTSSGIIENSAQAFALSWSVGTCAVTPNPCINTDNEIFAEEKCSILNNPTGIFGKCHAHIPTDHYHRACIQQTCNNGRSLQQSVCVALGNYAKACANQGVFIGDWRTATNCSCHTGKVCVHCAENPVNTARKTCDSLSKPVGVGAACDSGCYCPYNQYEDHLGNCVSVENCTCVYSGRVFSAGQSVKSNCKTCVCGQGQWTCSDQPCSGKCQVYGNGHYQTFDSNWYRFSGHCQYTFVEVRT